MLKTLHNIKGVPSSFTCLLLRSLRVPALSTRTSKFSSITNGIRIIADGGNGKENSPSTNQQNLQKVVNQYQEKSRKRILDETVKFPNSFIIKVIGTNEGDFLNTILQIISKTSHIPLSEVVPTVKENGKFLSITVNPTFHSADAVYATYSELSKDKRVKFVL
jgi:putative lipoic acid-binding regulatory protein